MASITLKNIPDDLYIKIKAAADHNRRSIDNKVIYYLEKILKSRKINPAEFIEQIDEFY